MRFLKACFQGWIYCRDHWQQCVDITLETGPTLPKGHQTWQMNEINKLVWPASRTGIGVMNKAAYARTAQIAQDFKVISKAPTGAYRTDLALKAVRSSGRQASTSSARSGRPRTSRSPRAASSDQERGRDARSVRPVRSKGEPCPC